MDMVYGDMLVRGYKLSIIRWVKSEDLMDSLVTIINNMVLYTWNLLKVDLKCSHHIHIKELTMWGDGYVNYLDLDNNFPMYMYIKSSHCIL